MTLKRNCGRADFLIKADGSNGSYLTTFKSCTARMPDKNYLYFGAVNLQNSSKLQFVMTIPLSYLNHYQDGNYYLDINISSQEVSVPTPPPLVSPPAPLPSPKDVYSEKLYTDSTYHDVFFVFDGSSTSSDTQQGVTTTSTVGAHKLILAQWPYFSMMFESGFSEGGPGEKRIRVKDTKAPTFKLLLRYMYTEKLSEFSQPTVAYRDAITNMEEVSWEDLYLAADRYEVDALRQNALGHLLPGSKSEGVIPFLFRTAYLFEELRTPVIKHIAMICSSEIADKTTQQIYADHPQCRELFGEIIAQLNARALNIGK
ncbi:MAG: hypothetical protein BYD32DRAFT_437535 [Podila humilis]|nr:MAG: hypothetical protein BYD32DRAFT_437535 [Podila humilis]